MVMMGRVKEIEQEQVYLDSQAAYIAELKAYKYSLEKKDKGMKFMFFFVLAFTIVVGGGLTVQSFYDENSGSHSVDSTSHMSQW